MANLLSDVLQSFAFLQATAIVAVYAALVIVTAVAGVKAVRQ